MHHAQHRHSQHDGHDGHEQHDGHDGHGTRRWPPTWPRPAALPTQPLVDTAWLHQHRGAVVLLQVDDDSSAYYQRHLPTARPIDTFDELHQHVHRGPVHRAGFEQLMDAKGVRRDDHVVLYSAGDPTHAAFAFWLMRLYGHPRLSLLDGGLRAWAAAGHPLSDQVPTWPGPHQVPAYTADERDASLIIGREEVLTRYVDAPAPALVLDCRTPGEYRGSEHHQLDVAAEQHRVPGHVPGSRNLPSALVLNPDGTFKARSELLALFASRGLAADSQVVLYCRLAERSSLLWFALAELVGHPGARHYVGGWAEYGSLIDAPVTRGETSVDHA
ncbi:sulfurtransferase [Kineococcus sp. SYSU DK005]|uniref:sulfurtransferase n=1 Tax=Kineococcus sp. SYSU DK005 TaxID=3383126 RepID=UPI003D7D0E82